MDETGTFTSMLVGILGGMLMAFGLVLLFVFFGSPDTCRAAVYSISQFLL